MKRRSICVLVMLLLIFPLFAEGSMKGMLICIHEGPQHKEDAVHIHAGGVLGHYRHPCEPFQFGANAEPRETTCRHVPVSSHYSFDALSHRPEKRLCGAFLLFPFEFPSQAPAAIFCAHSPSSAPIPSKTVDFRKTTVLII